MTPDEIRRAMRINPDPALLIPIGLIPLLKVVKVRQVGIRFERNGNRVKRTRVDTNYRALAWNPRELHEFFEEMMEET